MLVKTATFQISNTTYTKCPAPIHPEFAFIGRSNVGKSSLINMLVNQKKMALTSGNPGKTQTINHFLINKNLYIADLPGYGYAKTSKVNRSKWQKMIRDYLFFRPNLLSIFVLADLRHPPQQVDLDFMSWLGTSDLPFAIVFTKADKVKPQMIKNNLDLYFQKLLETWESVPPHFITSSEKGTGKTELLDYIEDTSKVFKYP
jgi:GTP-binding protein